MLDKTIHAHLDKQEKLEIAVEDDIDALIKVVSVKKIIESPEEFLLAIVEEVKNNIKENYAQEAIENGIQFAKDIQETNKKIKIQRATDGKMNDDNSKDNRQD